MVNLKLNLRKKNQSEIVITDSLNASTIKCKFIFKALSNDKNIYGKASFVIGLEKNVVKITKINIINLQIQNSDSSNNFNNLKNVYTLNNSLFDSSSDSSCDEKKIYKSIKKFIKSIKVKINNKNILNVIFNISNTNIKKINIRGELYKK